MSGVPILEPQADASVGPPALSQQAFSLCTPPFSSFLLPGSCRESPSWSGRRISGGDTCPSTRGTRKPRPSSSRCRPLVQRTSGPLEGAAWGHGMHVAVQGDAHIFLPSPPSVGPLCAPCGLAVLQIQVGESSTSSSSEAHCSRGRQLSQIHQISPATGVLEALLLSFRA